MFIKVSAFCFLNVIVISQNRIFCWLTIFKDVKFLFSSTFSHLHKHQIQSKNPSAKSCIIICIKKRNSACMVNHFQINCNGCHLYLGEVASKKFNYKDFTNAPITLTILKIERHIIFPKLSRWCKLGRKLSFCWICCADP